MLEIVATSDRPDLAPVVARWLWDEFWQANGHSFEETLEAVAHSVTAQPMPRTFILLRDGAPVGTASLVENDLPERPDLNPWLAGVVVDPSFRRNGYVANLVAAVEREGRILGAQTLWLYTRTAERIYARLGWRNVETVRRNEKSYALMMRDLKSTSP